MKDKANSGPKKITVFLPDDVHTASAVKLAEKGGKPKGFSFQSVITSLLREWAGGARAVIPEASKVEIPGPDRYRDDLARLLRVLENGSPGDRQLIRGMITMADDALAGRKPKDVPVNPIPSSKKPPNRPHSPR